MPNSTSIYDCLSKCIDKQTELSDVVKQCMSDCQPDKYTAPLLWVGFYIAAASLVCMIAMGTDLVDGFRTRKSWFPCKYFTLNAAISAVLAIALKMPVDLSTSMPCGRDQLMKLSATALMSVSMANFMPSLAAMSDPELFANLMALAVFIVPLISNICIQIGTEVIYLGVAVQHVIILLCIVVQFALLVSTAIACPSMKQQLDAAYEKEARTPTTSSDDRSSGRISKELLKQWIMAQTSSPQFVIARSVICTASGAICVLTVLVLAESMIQLYITMSKKFMLFFPSSDYDWSATLIVLVQAAAVLVGSISPISRWLTVVWFKFEAWIKPSCRDLWTVEQYWTERLEELKNSQLGVNPRHVKFNIFIRDGKVMFLNLFIKFQTFTVLSCRFLCLASLVFLLPFVFVYKIIVVWRAKRKSIDEYDSKWILKLDKEPDLPKSTVKKIISVVDGYFNRGRKKAVPENQMNLLEKSDGFDGIREFDRNLIEELSKITIDGVSNNPNGRWAIRIVTLSTIVCAIKPTWDEEFVSMVNNILPHVIYVEKALIGGTQANKNAHPLGDAARDVWLGVVDSRKWLKTELLIKSTAPTTLKMKLESLQKSNKEARQLHDMAVTWMNETVDIVLKFLVRQKKNIDERMMHEQMSRMVLDILVACLVNLGRAITLNISNAPIEKREWVVKRAASILGKTAEIQKLVDKRFSSIIDSPDQEEYVHASWWKAVMPKTPLEDAIKSSKSSVICDEHRIEMVESKSISLNDDDDNNEHESKQEDA